MRYLRKPQQDEQHASILFAARISGLQSCLFLFTGYGIRGRGRSPREGDAKGCRYGNCFISGAVRFFAGNGNLFDIFEIRDFKNGIESWFASPRVRQRRGRWSPPSVAPAGSRPEATGVFNPSWNSLAASGRHFSHRLFPVLRKKKDLTDRSSPWGSHGGPSRN